MPKLYYVQLEGGPNYRVWREGWAWDQWVTFDEKGFAALRELGFTLVQHKDED